MSYPQGSNILGGFCCRWGQYNTHQMRSALYETGPVNLFGATAAKPVAMQGYLVSCYVKLSSLITNGDYEIYIMDTSMDPAAIVAGGLAGVIAAGGYALAISDVKVQSADEGGGVFGYDPPTEELIPVRVSEAPHGHQDIVEMKGRPFYKGLAIVLVDPSDNSISEEDSAMFIDCRYIFSQLEPAFVRKGE